MTKGEERVSTKMCVVSYVTRLAVEFETHESSDFSVFENVCATKTADSVNAVTQKWTDDIFSSAAV